MFKRLVPVAIAAAAFAVPASAATVITITPSPNPCAGKECAFTIAGTTTDKNFTGSATFSIPGTGSLAGVVTNVKINKVSNIDFSSVSITGPGPMPTTYNFNVVNGVVDTATLLSIPTMAGTYTFTASGISGGNATFGGNISFAGVPEASTWGLLILGFGVIGGALRRTKARPALKYA